MMVGKKELVGCPFDRISHSNIIKAARILRIAAVGEWQYAPVEDWYRN
jgi:hypothetical protein